MVISNLFLCLFVHLCGIKRSPIFGSSRFKSRCSRIKIGIENCTLLENRKEIDRNYNQKRRKTIDELKIHGIKRYFIFLLKLCVLWNDYLRSNAKEHRLYVELQLPLVKNKQVHATQTQIPRPPSPIKTKLCTQNSFKLERSIRPSSEN